MSTPTTATATLPHYNPHHFPYSHHSQQAYSHQANTSSYRSANNAIPASSRLPIPLPSPTTYSSASSQSTLNGMSSLSAPTTVRSLPEPAPLLPPLANSYSAAMPTVAQARQLADQPQNPRKRRRTPRKVDWKEFFGHKNPEEIIVIDDTPEPEGTTASSSASQAMPKRRANGVNASSGDSSDCHVAKRRRRDEEPTHYDPVYHNAIASPPVTVRHLASPSKSTVSSDRTNSAVHTTAATSLGSLSSNGHYEYDAPPGQKRKRTTRAQLASEAKRREPCNSYKPPAYPIKKAADVHVKVVTDPPHQKNVKVDDEDGHYIVVPDNDLTDRYQMIRLLGQGTFGKVVQARDRKRNKLVAIKIIRSVQKYRDASKIELRVLATLKANDEENRNRCIHLRDCFDYRGHICIVMDLLGQSIFDFLKSNNFVPFPNSQIQNFARQLFTSVAFLHDLNLIHTDLKPENILLCQNEYQTFTYNRKIPSSSQSVARQATQRKVLLDTEIRLIDFGSATFQDEYHSSVVSTRHYRAPEIILGLGWSYPCDIWSIGCILVEFFTGDALFQTHDNLEHLAMMEVVVDKRIDTHLVSAVNKPQRNQTNAAAKYFKRLKLDYPTQETSRASKRFVKAMKKLDDIIPNNTPFLKLFLDLLKKIFVYDQDQRITAKQALQHPWFREAPHPDDGTEAAKIRATREAERLEELARAPVMRMP